MRDEPRADAKAGLDALKAPGIATVMLTGDNATHGGSDRQAARHRGRAPSCCRRTSSGSSASCRARARWSPRSATASTTPRRWRPPTSASPWAAAPTWRWRPPTPPCCTAASSTSPRMIALSKRTMAQHPAEHHHRARPQGGVPGHHHHRHHRPLAGDPGRHRRDRAGHRQRHAPLRARFENRLDGD